MFKKATLILGILAMAACGGGGGSDSAEASVETTQSFSLAKLQSTTLGTIYSAQLTGSDSNRVSYSGSVSLVNRAQRMIGGVLVTPQDVTISLTGGGISVTSTSTSNIDPSGYVISIVIPSAGVTCIPSSPYKMPSAVTIGESGLMPPSTCSDGTVQDRSWRVEDAGTGRARVVGGSTVKSRSGIAIATAEAAYTIDSGGNVVKFKAVSTILADGFTLTYENR
jgi:hypothetical protein